jgi:hypothetical protein
MTKNRKNQSNDQTEDPEGILPPSGGTHHEGTTGAGGISGPNGYIGDKDE